jgi:BON domain
MTTMNRPLLKKVFPQILCWVAVVLLCGVVALAQDQNTAPQAGQRTDGQIEMDVVHALDASAALKNDLITAATIQGEVTLSGTVSADASSKLAESIASHVAGVTKVQNNLTVGDPQQAAAGDPNAQQMADNQPDGSAAPAPDAAPSAGPDQPMGPYPPAPPPTRPQYAPPPRQYAQAPPQPPAPAYQTPNGPVTVPEGTLLQLRTSEAIGTKHAQDGQPVQFTVIQDVAYGGFLAIPRGAVVHGVVTDAKKAGALGGSPELALKLTSLDLGGQSYPLDSDQFKVKGPNKAGQTVGSAVGGGIIGTIIGCAVGRGVGCAVGAGAGVAAGTAASAASGGPGVWIPAEALVTFHLKTPVTVNPVNAQEAARLAQGLYQGGPSLYRRGYYPYGSPYAGYGYPYAYPSVYYRPYYMAGGYYYWR